MSSIVAFKEFESRRLSRQTTHVEQGDAEIILFTGVQYERTDVVPPETDGTPLRGALGAKRKRRPF
ncbi:hypothetical protein [Ahrensia kielensis]|uniref:Uncharacterized protein n=1 Tax=Ahrensia kielensis TaxID=76980 RepID=A0ABU9T899_9HYPH|nr:hypothetical protein [Ahrensia kielensis]